ncbi:MAG TPA: hypothetical protein VGO60_02355 [Iamia sp.]|jgi:hypothetical protein|nr:hypothetical protein [Iamia sp.]
MRRPRGRAPLLLSALALVAALGAGCSDDDGGDDTTPTTTSPRTETSDDGGDTDATTTTETPETTASEPTGSGGEVPPPAEGTEVALDAGQAEAVIGQLLTRLQAVMAAAKADGDDAETLRAGLTEVFDATEAADQFDGINEFGGLPVVSPEPGTPTVDGVEVVGGSGTCVTGTAEIDLDPLMTQPVGALQPYSFRLEPAGDGAPAPAWRLSYMGFVREGAYTENAACPA